MAEVASLRELMRKGMREKTIPKVALPPAPPVASSETLVLPRAADVPVLADLTGKKRLIIAIGPQNAGKTMDMRMIASELHDAGRLGDAMFAAADHGPRTLGLFIDGINQPSSSSQEDGVQFIREVHGFMRDGGDDRPALFILDCGGNNVSLPAAAAENPRFVAELEDAGVEVVFAYYFVPRTDDLVLLEMNEALRLTSQNTMLTMNLGMAARGLESFEVMRAQDAWQRAIQSGAAELVMPKLSEEWAQETENRRLPFWMARDGKVPEGLTGEPLPVRGRVAVAGWMARWRTARGPVRAWLG